MLLCGDSRLLEPMVRVEIFQIFILQGEDRMVSLLQMICAYLSRHKIEHITVALVSAEHQAA